MKKKKLHGLSLNKKSIANFATVVAGADQVPAPTNYKGCEDSIVDCILTERCVSGANCDTLFCSNFNCGPHPSSIPFVCC